MFSFPFTCVLCVFVDFLCCSCRHESVLFVKASSPNYLSARELLVDGC